MNLDDDIVPQRSHYAIPHALVRVRVDARGTSRTGEVAHKNQRVASHGRRLKAGSYAKAPSHVPNGT